MHVLCTSIEPRMTTPSYVQFRYSSRDKSRSRDDVLATHFGEAIHPTEHPTPPSPGDDSALLEDILASRSDDELPGQSQEDQTFLAVIDEEVSVSKKRNIVLPLPFKDGKSSLPDNHSAVFGRTRSTLRQMSKTGWKLEQSLLAMQHNLDMGYVEAVLDSNPSPPAGGMWYIPVFPVVHSKKHKIRLVFGASAQYLGISINDSLYQGPDLTNRLHGVLLRFREKPVAIQADIQDMFLKFEVPKHQRDYFLV